MKKVLLAINGDTPTKTIFRYAVDLCRRMKADLDIIQIIKEKRITDCISSTKKKVESFNRAMEDSFAGVAFAEENFQAEGVEITTGISPPLKHLIEQDKPEVLKQVTLGNGDLETELSIYIENRKNVVLTIFDPSSEERKRRLKNRFKIKLLRKKLCVPLVVVKT